MYWLLFFLLLVVIIRWIQMETKITLIISIIIIYLIYQSPNTIISQINDKVFSSKKEKDIIPEIYSQKWYHYWKTYFKDIKEHNDENYFDIMKALKHFHQTYNQVFTGVEMPQQHLDNLSLLEKEMLNLLHSTIHSLPATKGEKLDNILQEKIDHFQKELEWRMEDLRNFINKDWNEGKINNRSKPIYPGELATLPYQYSSNYHFY